jgi:hypothetical protein
MRWLLAAAIVTMALTYCIEAAVDDNATIISSYQDSLNILANKDIINNREAENLNANSGDLTAQPTVEPDTSNTNDSYSLLKERLDENLNYINNSKNSLNFNVPSGISTSGLGELFNIDTNSDFLNEKNHADNSSKNDALLGSSNAASNINSKFEYLYERSHVDRVLGGKDPVASQDAASDINSKLGYLFENSRSDKNNAGQVQITSSDVGSSINSKLGYAYEYRRYDRGVKTEKVTGSDIASNINSKLGYIYENSRPDKSLKNKFLIASPNVASDTDSIIGGLYHMGMYQNDSNAPGKTFSNQGIVSLLNSNLDRICIQIDPYNISRSDGSLVENWFNNEEFYPLEPDLFHSNAFRDLSLQWGKKLSSHKNYAVVVGINNYDDRKGLHASENDANYLGSLLKSLGYEVITLTDGAEIKPTKHNILEGALKEISLKKDRGNVVLYFSGHGEVDNKGNFYIIPQDGDGDLSSYISEDEVNQYLKGMKNLAIIIDACNSGAFKVAADKDQLILTSSNENEPSNENWTAPVSVFTYYLCQSIEEEGKVNKEIIMQKAFSRAYNDTLMWSTNHLVRQTPCKVDTTNGQYYLN